MYPYRELVRLHGQIHRGVKSQASLVRSKGRVVLNTVAPVYLHIALVVFPDNAELYDTFGNRNNLQGRPVFRVLCEKRAILERADELWDKSDKAWGGSLGRSIHTVVGLLELGLRR